MMKTPNEIFADLRARDVRQIAGDPSLDVASEEAMAQLLENVTAHSESREDIRKVINAYGETLWAAGDNSDLEQNKRINAARRAMDALWLKQHQG
jgi:DNA/RNA-binding domain of Phe-tRNA-synthetase-like protein